MTLKHHEKRVLNFHENKTILKESAARDIGRDEFNKAQQVFFDSVADWFASEESVPMEVRPRLREIIRAGFPEHLYNQSELPAFLDVGCGAGVLFKPMRQLYPSCHISGVDLAARQLETAHSRFEDATLWQGDITDFQPEDNRRFDTAWCNACFANFYNPQLVVTHIASLLKPGGRLLITHPLGETFVKALHAKDPGKVPHTLPANQTIAEELAQNCNLAVESLLSRSDLYILIYRKPDMI